MGGLGWRRLGLQGWLGKRYRGWGWVEENVKKEVGEGQEEGVTGDLLSQFTTGMEAGGLE